MLLDLKKMHMSCTRFNNALNAHDLTMFLDVETSIWFTQDLFIFLDVKKIRIWSNNGGSILLAASDA